VKAGRLANLMRTCYAKKALLITRSPRPRFGLHSYGFSSCLCALAAAVACGAPSSDGLYGPRAGAGGTAAGAGGTSAGNGGNGGASGEDAGLGSGGTGGTAGASGAAGSAGAPPELGDAGADALPPDAGPDAAPPQEQVLECLPADQANCDVLLTSLVHRYSFDGTGATVVDDVGTANGTVENGQLSGSGAVLLDNTGTDPNYVNLPNGIVSALFSATFEAWVVWGGGDPWQRIFDFGSSNSGEDVPNGGEEYIFLATSSAATSTTPNAMRVGFLSGGSNGEQQLNVSPSLTPGVEKHVAVVMNGQNGSIALYVDGALADSGQSVALQGELSNITDNNNWLGRSQFSADAGFEGSLLEFRIYDSALNANQIALSFDLGPDAPVSP